MWWLRAASSKNLNTVLTKAYTKRKGEQIQKLIQHGHPDFTGRPEEEVATQIHEKEANDPLGARKLYARYSLPAKDDGFKDSEYDFIKKRDAAKLEKVKQAYQNKEKKFFQAVGEIAADNTVIINSIENTLKGSILSDSYNKGIVTSEILKIADQIDPDKYKGKRDIMFNKVYKRVDSAFNSFKKFDRTEKVPSSKCISYLGDRIDDSLNLLQGSLELEEHSQQQTNSTMEDFISSILRINSQQSVSSSNSHTQRLKNQRREIFPNLHSK